MDIQIIAVPYDSGHKAERMGCGPVHFIEGGVERVLGDAGHKTQIETVESDDAFYTEVGTTFRLHRRVAVQVRAAKSAGRFPITLAGNCGLASIGTVAGLSGKEPIGVIWFDAHGDFNTPETTASGFLDGMALSVVTGRCWKTLASTIPSFEAVPEKRVIHAGGRDLDKTESEMMQSSDMCILTPERIAKVGLVKALKPGLEYISLNTEQVYIHVDLDALDPAEAPANHFAMATPGGLKVAELLDAIEQIGERMSIAGAGIASYDPVYDPDDRVLKAGFAIMTAIAENAHASGADAKG